MRKLIKNVGKLSVLLLLNSLLISCGQVSFNCPKPTYYSKDFQNEISDALKRANEPILNEIILNYGNLREELKL